MGKIHVEINGTPFIKKQLEGNSGNWTFPAAGEELGEIDPRGDGWVVTMDHIYDGPGDDDGNRHDATGNVAHHGQNYFAEVIFSGDKRTIFAGERKIAVTFVHEPGGHGHSIFSKLFQR